MTMSHSTIDKLWSLLFGLIVVALGLGCMFLAAAYLTPALVGPPIGGSRHGIAALVEFVVLFGGLFVGLLIATRVIVLLTRRYSDTATQARWEQDFQRSIASAPVPLRNFLQFINRLARP